MSDNRTGQGRLNAPFDSTPPLRREKGDRGIKKSMMISISVINISCDIIPIIVLSY